MAIWKNIGSRTGGSLKGTFEYEGAKSESTWKIYQDEKPFLKHVQEERSRELKENKSHMKKFATIPDIVAIEIAEKYGIDIHDPDFSRDKDRMAKFKRIIMTEYKHLVINNA